MKKITIFLLFIMIFLMSCASNEAPENNGQNNNLESDRNENNTSSSKEVEDDKKSDGFEEIDLIDVEGIVSTVHFGLDQDGDTMHWGEKDTFASNDLRGKVWMDGEIISMDMDRFGHGSIITPSGKIANSESEDRIYTVILLDPRTGEVEEFTKDDGNNDIIIPAIFNFREDPLAYAKRREYTDGLQYFVWYLESNDFVEFDMTEFIEGEVGEIANPQYGTVMLSTNGEKVLLGYDEGIFQYDIETQEMDTLLTKEDNALTLAYTNADDNYLLYFVNEQDDDFNHPLYAIDLETKEKFEIGLGRNPHMLDDGTMFYQNNNELFVYDFETRESQLLYTVELEEDEELKFVRISQDGSTLAYAYEIELEKGEEMKIRVLRAH
ncbi:hypothetical protein [Ornithinibacillus halotolerans]|uniref:DUF5050 domain-containing protein n=1 Tax=Ornithinibacillus halotolerans TaxID=1274357 RepID=A0A916SDZ2_9BACI|nr:hypothetical protein [Ornithinibacillus halotolerans]GGA92763.1 hypothetical protein GCM10008025_38980 [Ornithinibacillus halotolerans]